MDKATALKIARKYAQEVVKEMSPDKVLLFGSYAKGGAKDESDIDIAVIFDGFQGDWFYTCTTLSNLTWNISTYIEPVLLDARDDQSGFVEEVLKTGEVVYQSA
ncbi:MAG: nucleotidyltransferase domain-containing protein [Oscillospiraceae bacterium]|nr:nucleotidyltransferase domain-containing protein [Oscillospiraceae bacterium]